MALAYAREGADVVISYLNEHEDAKVRGARICSWRVGRVRVSTRAVLGNSFLDCSAVSIFAKLLSTFTQDSKVRGAWLAHSALCGLLLGLLLRL